MTMTYELTPVSCQKYSNVSNNKRLKRNSIIGPAIGIGIGLAYMSKGSLKNFKKMEFGTKQVIELSLFSTAAGYLTGIFTDKENKKAKNLEYFNQMIGNELIPLGIMELVHKTIKTQNKFLRTTLLTTSLVLGTIFGHKVSGDISKKCWGTTKDYKLKLDHFAADADDLLIPLAVGTKSKFFMNALKVLTPITYLPMGKNIAQAKLDQYY